MPQFEDEAAPVAPNIPYKVSVGELSPEEQLLEDEDQDFEKK
jgi:hypothetical protein